MRLLNVTPCAFLSLLHLAEAVNPRPYPPADGYLQTTSILDHASYLMGLDDQQWYLDNIPFIDVPDQQIQDVYYYRTSVVKRHIKWAHEGAGWMVTEFIHPVSWASKYQTIPDSAAHHIVELRWLRDPNYVKNLIESYTRGGIEALSGITYTHYVHHAILEHAQATGDRQFLTSQLDGMVNMYNLWNVTRDNTTGLYHRAPLQDAQEYSLIGYLVGGPGGGPMQEWNDFGLDASMGGGNDYDLIWFGPETYRPDFNAYMVAGAWATAEIAAMAGRDVLARTWHDYGDQLLQRQESQLYSDELNFWIDVELGTNYRAEGRQLIGYFPYRFGVGTNETYIRGLEAGLTEDHFVSDFGPTTLSQSNPYFTALKNSSNCCVWNGQSWPFSTGVYLTTLAYIARDGLSDVVTPEFFFQELGKYARTNYKDGVPYTGESHYPHVDRWSGDTTNHSEHYLHSTYMDNIFTNLFGIVPTFDNELVLRPLVPSDWSYFAIENLPYHGTLLTLVWDQDGSHYGGEAGFSIYSNGTRFHHGPEFGPLNVTLPFDTAAAAQRLAAHPEWQNILANPNVPYGLPEVTADWQYNPDGDLASYNAWKMNDGLLWYDTTPDNWWTHNQSTVPYATVNITLPRARRMTGISLAVFADVEHGGVVDCPDGIRVRDGRTGQVLAYQQPWTDCVRNALNTVPFAPPGTGGARNETTPLAAAYEHETDFLQLVLSDRLTRTVAVSEIQIWVPPAPGPRYEAEDGLVGTFIGGWQGRATGLNATVEDGGVVLGEGGWVELAGVRTADGEAADARLTVVGGGQGTVEVGVNYLANRTLEFSGEANRTVDVRLLRGANVVTIYQTEGRPFVDAFVVGSA